MRKKGVSSIVVIILIILISIIAIVLVWNFIKYLNNSNLNKIAPDLLTLDMKIKSVVMDSENNQLDVVIDREPGKARVVGINFVLGNKENTITKQVDEGIDILETKKFILDIDSEIDIWDIEFVGIAPIVLSVEDSPVVGKIVDICNLGLGAYGNQYRRCNS